MTFIMNTDRKSMYGGGRETYEAPTVEMLDMSSEGVLCSSYDAPDYGYDDDNDLGEI